MSESLAGNFSLHKGMHLHLVGIGGSGMSSIARVLLGRGFVVSGSDQNDNRQTATLRQEGAKVFIGHDANHIKGAEGVIISSAIPGSNPEILAAREANVAVLKRADFLGLLMDGFIGIAVAGSHGKTTTTGMIAHVLLENGQDPTVILGGVLTGWQVNGRSGQGKHFVVEADEYDYMFLGLKPQFCVITNIEHDHPDMFPTEKDYLDAFSQFVQRISENGTLVYAGDDEGAANMTESLEVPGVTMTSYGIPDDSNGHSFDFQALDARPNHLGGTDFLVQKGSEILGLVRLRIPGLHNVRNGLATIIIALNLGLDFADICRALASFGGVGRRFQITGEIGGVTIIDDYAHHPTEIRATLAAAKQRYPGRRIWAVWQPHTYSRTKMMQAQFADCFDDADKVVVLDIYRSREVDTLGVDAATVVQSMKHPSAIHVAEKHDVVNYLLDRILSDDVVLTLGAGDGNIVGQELLAALKKRLQTYHP
ncbi:MAG: UDP-N-acetylmuramate--L-alanine ligase [Candidatus Promineifilaceae bacterium]|nr:UDP-N-acetylmuramate--L-alanine ligase [Candidatus Promineifilaceae bacterium]